MCSCIGRIENEGDIRAPSQIVKIFDQMRCSIVAIQEVPDDKVHNYGIIAGDDLGMGSTEFTI